MRHDAGLSRRQFLFLCARLQITRLEHLTGTQNVEATPEHRANPYRPGAWLFTPDTEATLNRRAALIISPVDPVDRCTALCQSHRRLKHRAAPRLPRGASASGVTGTKF
ncbi:unnamed protein product [Pleuronectes platessa]|uniref:Uncharacterized protein n=1 Tax=Pleuronectes platessa TaxID=8262 RepID=A0A9N7VWR1_PLEPL|nr:unnamed protein product [Pleuronectes platessa]